MAAPTTIVSETLKLLDINLLLYVTNPKAAHHEPARVWFDDLMNSGESVGLPWHTLLGFVRAATQPALRSPLSLDDAFRFVEEWLAWETVWTPEPTSDHCRILANLLRSNPRCRLVSDAHLAALAIEHGLTLCSADAGFKLFSGLRFHNPLEALDK